MHIHYNIVYKIANPFRLSVSIQCKYIPIEIYGYRAILQAVGIFYPIAGNIAGYDWLR